MEKPRNSTKAPKQQANAPRMGLVTVLVVQHAANRRKERADEGPRQHEHARNERTRAKAQLRKVGDDIAEADSHHGQQRVRNEVEHHHLVFEPSQTDERRERAARRPHEEHKGSHADSETHDGDGGRPAPRLTGHALTYGHATLVQRENHAGESYDDGEELQRIQTHRLRGLRLRDALESYGQRDEHNNGDDDDENRTPRPDTGHSATNGGIWPVRR